MLANFCRITLRTLTKVGIFFRTNSHFQDFYRPELIFRTLGNPAFSLNNQQSHTAKIIIKNMLKMS